MKQGLVRDIGMAIFGAALGVLLGLFNPFLRSYFYDVDGYVKVAEIKVSIIGRHITEPSYGIEYLKINSLKKENEQYSLHLEFRVIGSTNVEDKRPLHDGNQYTYNWNDRSYIIYIEDLPESGDSAVLTIHQERS